MALFESYERRIDKINKALDGYGISSLEEAKKSVMIKASTLLLSLEAFSLSALKTLAGLTL